MFGILQGDIPIGRTLWLVVLGLVARSVVSGSPIPSTDDPTLLAVNLLIFAGHSVLVGTLVGLVPSLTVRMADAYYLWRRALGRGHSALPFERLRCDSTIESMVSAAIVVAAIIAAPSFGQSTLTTTGRLGLGIMLISHIIDVEQLVGEADVQVVELRSSETECAATLASARARFEITLTEDWITAFLRLLDGGWKLLNPSDTGRERRAVFQRTGPRRRLRMMSKWLATVNEFKKESDLRNGVAG